MLPSELVTFKKSGKTIVALTAWDSISSSIVQASGADIILVGDSLAMFVHGHSTTLPITLEQMLHHTQSVCRGVDQNLTKKPIIISDLPFLSYQCGEDKAVEAAGTIIKNSCASAVKIEGGEPEIIKVVERLTRMGIPVMGHLGLTPQSVKSLGLKKQAQDPLEQEKIIAQALQLQNAGCFGIVIEHVPNNFAKKLTNTLEVPVIGIGAGENCDGQIRVTADLLGLTERQPPFTKSLVNLKELSITTLRNWVDKQH